MFTIDFETKPIIQGNNRTPEPVGVSIKKDNESSKYFAFGHPTNNNSTKADVQRLLELVYDSGESILCHNSKFDLRICLEHFDLPVPDSSRIFDSMIMAYLVDPREDLLGLKPLAEKYCGMPPDDQKVLNTWLKSHGYVPGQDIAYAPGDLVGRYAESDTDMTYALFHYLKPLVLIPYADTTNIRTAFDREMKLLPVVIDMEMRGVHITSEIHSLYAKLEKQFSLLDMQLFAYGDGAKPGSKAMFNAFMKKGYIDKSKLQYTDKGNPRYGKDFIEDIISNRDLTNVLKMRGKLQKMVGTYIKPFAKSSELYGNKFYPYYNQTRSDDDRGTRTGRFSSNIQQLPKDSGVNAFSDGSGVSDEVPSIRTLIVAPPGKVLIKRDFSGQELRVVAHYAEGPILDAYLADPRMDVHAFVDGLIQEKTGHHLSRTPVKMINFLKLYGGGPTLLAEKLKIPEGQARQFFAAYDEALPEFKGLMKDIENMSRSGKKIRTWGGRMYDVEPPKIDPKTGRRREFYYKLGNVLIQGSSADMTKEAMIRYFYHPDRKGDILMQVHDELVVEIDEAIWKEEMELLQWAMDEIPGWDVPLCSDGSVGYNLGSMQKYDDITKTIVGKDD